MTEPLLALEVVYALPERQTRIEIRVAAGTTVEQALVASGIFALHPETRGADAVVGIFGHVVGRDYQPADGDRIEIYRPLIADPKTSRNARVAKKRALVDNPRNMRA